MHNSIFETLERLVGKWSICASMTYGFVFNTTSNEYRKDFTLDSAYALFCRQSQALKAYAFIFEKKGSHTHWLESVRNFL